MILHERVKGRTKPTRAKSSWTYKHRDVLTAQARAHTRAGSSLTEAAALLDLPVPTVCRWIALAIRAEQGAAKKKGAA